MLLQSDVREQLFRGERLACELPAKHADHRRFVVVAGFKDAYADDEAWPTLPWRFRVDGFEVKADIIDEQLDSESVRDFSSRVVSTDELEAAVAVLTGGDVVFRSAQAVGAPQL